MRHGAWLLVLGVLASRDAMAQVATPNCASDAACAKGWQCDALPGEAPRCRPRCELGCRSDERCTTLAPFTVKRAPVCVPNVDRLCRLCAADVDCGLPRDACIDQVSGERTCGRDCAWDGACPANYRCVDPGGVDGQVRPRQCVPTGGCCNCDAPEVGERNAGLGEGAVSVVEPPWAPPTAPASPPARPTPAPTPGGTSTEYDPRRAGPGGFPVLKARNPLPRPDWWYGPEITWGAPGSAPAPTRSSSSTPRTTPPRAPPTSSSLSR